MKDQFRREDREFEEGIFRNAAQQGLSGPAGNEITRDVIVDQLGRKHEISYRVTTIRTDDYGMPYMMTERGSKELSCSHVAHSASEVSGRCIYGCLVCTQCPLFSCDWCGVKVCERCAMICKNGTILCQEHEGRRKWLVFKELLLG